MSSITEFIRRNRGKIIAGTAIAGGAYFVQKFVRQYYDGQQQQRNGNLSAFGLDPQRLMLQNRRFYIFDSNQRTCDSSILQIVPSIKTKLQKRFDIETLADTLKKSSENASTKIEMWNEMKTDAFSRLLSASISYTILVLSLKTQISILAAQIYENSIQSVPHKFESWYSRLWHSMGGPMTPVKPVLGEAKRTMDLNALKNSSAVQQLFLQALQYFVNKGVDSLTDFLHPIVADELSKTSLKDPLTYDQLKKTFQNLRAKINSVDSARHFSFYVVPLSHTGTLPDEPTLEELLIILKTVLETPDAQQIFDYGVDLFIEDALKFVRDNVSEFQQHGDGLHKVNASSTPITGVPLARLIPVLTSAFHEISRVNFDSVLNNFVISRELHEFCVKVFERDQSIW